MKNVNTSSVNATVESIEAETVEQVTPAEATENLVAEVLESGKLKGIKASLRKRSWIDIVGAGVIAGMGTAASMVMTNKSNTEVYGDEANKYSVKDIAIVTGAAAVVGSVIRGALDFVPQVNDNNNISMVTTSVVGNGVMVGSTLTRNALLGLLKGKVSIDVEELAEEA